MKALLILGVVGMILASCAPVTPEKRIAANPSKYEKVPEKYRELVRRGELAPGMGPDAVYLAWGGPARVYEGSEKGARTMRWDYSGTMPVTTMGWEGYYGYGRYGRYPVYGAMMVPEVAYVPYRRASVWFRNEKVESWERSR